MLAPNAFSSLVQMARRLLAFQHFYEQIAKDWKRGGKHGKFMG
ncbi:MAG: hypothetical protein ABSG04_05180 [Verrucomicrobiota bacterium]